MTKTARQYEEVFEDLMEYSKFSNVSEIKSKSDLKEFFRSIQDDANARGRRFPLTKKLVFTMARAKERLMGVRKPTQSVNRRQTAIQGRPFGNIQVARQHRATFTQDGKEIFKAIIKIKNKPIIRYRDAKGRFAKNPNKGDK